MTARNRAEVPVNRVHAQLFNCAARLRGIGVDRDARSSCFPFRGNYCADPAKGGKRLRGEVRAWTLRLRSPTLRPSRKNPTLHAFPSWHFGAILVHYE